MNKKLQNNRENRAYPIRQGIEEAFKKIAPFWPLKNLIAVNPLQGFEDLPFEEALKEGATYFEQETLPQEMHAINRETIKWCQTFFDQGQAAIPMPLRKKGLYEAWRKLVPWDECLHQGQPSVKKWLSNLPETPEQAIRSCLQELNIHKELIPLFFTLLLATLPGWAAHIRYLSKEENLRKGTFSYELDYLAIRLIITTALWPQAFTLIVWYEEAKRQESDKSSLLKEIIEKERNYRVSLFEKLASQTVSEQPFKARAQLIFCIDVRSEPFRRALELQGPYETYGVAGFFGLPLKIQNNKEKEAYSSCPVLLTPTYCVHLTSSPSFLKKFQKVEGVRHLYQSLKYNFTTPFTLAETVGPVAALWMGMRTLFPKTAYQIKKSLYHEDPLPSQQLLLKEAIPLEDQSSYAEGMLKLIGLTKNFAPLIVLCGHGSTSVNNAFATALDCGACGGRPGAVNSTILASILNCPQVRQKLQEKNIVIPSLTHFIAAQHNTTTDEVTLLHYDANHQAVRDNLAPLKDALKQAQHINSQRRAVSLNRGKQGRSLGALLKRKSVDWAEIRPEWGLARNAAFIIGPRCLTQKIDLEGRTFLHSYDWQQDHEGKILTSILTAPMVVAQWINSQYLFSSLNNVAYGAGSKITHNITGKIGVMQGNASDLMHGLPLQSVYENDFKRYHEPLRLLTVVFAPKHHLQSIIDTSETLQKLFCNGWVHLACMEPHNNKIYMLERELSWRLHG